ncbi:hypothetical protein ACHAWF_000672, partial [Thalassiosira exigua]
MITTLRNYLMGVALTVPPAIYFKDNFYSLYRVEGDSMEPALYDGDVMLVRKSDVFPDATWRRWMSMATVSEDGEDRNPMKVMALDAQSGRPIGERLTGYTYLKPPTIHKSGSVVVFHAPDAEKYPSREYRVKRVIGLGGQICRACDNFHSLERVPAFSLWVEGDNSTRSVDSRNYGAVCKNNVIGIAEQIIWPPYRWGRILPQSEGSQQPQTQHQISP